jgi:mycothiol synthase
VPEIRPFHSSETGPAIELLARALPAENLTVERFVRQVLLDPNFAEEGALLAYEEDELAGFVLAVARQAPVEGQLPDRERGYITLLAVDERFRNRGLGARLLDEAEIYLITENRKEVWISPYSPYYFAPGVDVAAYSQGLGFLLRKGFEEIYRPISMEVELQGVRVPEWVQEKEKAALEQGVVFETWKPEATLGLLRFARQEFGADWARYVREAGEAILRGDLPDRLFFARGAGGRILGFSHYDRDRFGPIGVSSEARGRGLGQILMFRTLEAQRSAGQSRAYFLWSDDATARRLYDAAGFREARRFAVLRKEL